MLVSDKWFRRPSRAEVPRKVRESSLIDISRMGGQVDVVSGREYLLQNSKNKSKGKK